MWWIVHVVVLFIWFPLVLFTIPMHVISKVKSENAKTRKEFIRYSQQKR